MASFRVLGNMLLPLFPIPQAWPGALISWTCPNQPLPLPCLLQSPLLDSYKKAIKIAMSYVEGMKMKVANTVELKNQTNKILREVMKGQPVIITYRGKPAASLTPLSDEDLEDFILENSPKIRKMISEAVKDVKGGKLTSLEEYMKAS
jgi:prevent-host-death family protein